MIIKKLAPQDKPMISVLWDYFLMGMIAFFIISTINSLVNNHLNE